MLVGRRKAWRVQIRDVPSPADSVFVGFLALRDASAMQGRREWKPARSGKNTSVRDSPKGMHPKGHARCEEWL